MRLSAKGAQKTRNESKKLSMYSKQWSPGDTLRVLYPIFWENGKPELSVGAIWGHSVADIKGLGLKTAFIPSTNEFNADGEPIGPPDITYQFSRIAPAFVAGSKKIKEDSIMKKNFPTEAARREALNNLDHEYDTKNNMNAVKPIIGRAQYYVSTEVMSVKIVNGIPDKETIMVTSAPLSDEQIDKIYALMGDSKYAPMEGDEFFEVERKYPVNTDKGQSGKASTVSGLTPEYRLSATNPDVWALMQDRMPSIATEAESISRRATRSIDPVRIRQALTAWAFMHSEDLDAAEGETLDVLTNNAAVIKELDLARALTNDAVKKSVTDAIAKLDALAVAEPAIQTNDSVADDIAALAQTLSQPAAESVQEPAPAADDSVSLPDLSGITTAPTIQSLLHGENAMTDPDMLEQVDLSLGG